MVSTLYEIGIAIVAAMILALIARPLKQPIIIGYIVAGFIIGPNVLGLVQNSEVISSLSDFGVAFLLFIIGLDLDFKKIKELGISCVWIGFLQMILTAVPTYFISIAFGLNIAQALLVALAISLSSTLLVVKAFNETNQMDTIHGKLVLGILLIQDVVAVTSLSLIGRSSNFSGAQLLGLFQNAFLLVIVAFLFTKFVLPLVLKASGKDPEVLLITSLGISFLLGGLALYLHYSLAIGAFIAGISLASTHHAYEISGRVKPVRDFFVVLFFVVLGMSISTEFSGYNFGLFAVLLLVILLLKPLVTIITCKFFNYGNRTSFFTGAAIGQIDLFSIIIAHEAVTAGIMSESMFSLITILTIISMTLTAYSLRYNETLFRFFVKLMPSDKNARDSITIKHKMKDHIIIIGTHKMGMNVINSLAKESSELKNEAKSEAKNESRNEFLVIDHNPERVNLLLKRKIFAICTDMDNVDMYEELGFEHARAVISSVNNLRNNLAVIRQVRKINKEALIIVTTRVDEDALRLYEEGADFVVMPEILAGFQVTNYLKKLNPNDLRTLGKKYYKDVKDGLKG